MLSLLLYLNRKIFGLVLYCFFPFSVIFHVATLMPTRDSDPGCNSKKMHIGNDFVTIVYNDSQQTVKFGRIKVRFTFLRRRTLGLSRRLSTSPPPLTPPKRLAGVRNEMEARKIQVMRADQINCEFKVIPGSRKS